MCWHQMRKLTSSSFTNINCEKITEELYGTVFNSDALIRVVSPKFDVG